MNYFKDKIYYHHQAHRLFLLLFLLFFCSQIIFWYKTHRFRVEVEIVPEVISRPATQILSLGDREFLFRTLAMNLQNMGDVFAGFVSLKKYDYQRIYQWASRLDELNEQSRLVPSLVSYYYANNDNQADLIFLVKYLDEHASKNIDKNWWWMFQAIQIARIGVRDFDLALKLANKLASNNAIDAPLWTKQMPAFISKEKGDDCLAFQVINKILIESENNTRPISVDEMNFMRYFVGERLKSLKQKKFDPRQCIQKI